LWGFVKDIVYCEKVQDMSELHNKIVRATECITSEMLTNTCQCVGEVGMFSSSGPYRVSYVLTRFQYEHDMYQGNI